MKKEVQVFAPATVGNIGIGFDILGLALESPGDLVTARASEQKGIRIHSVIGNSDGIPIEVSRNTAGVAAKSLVDHLGHLEPGIELLIEKNMPNGSGLGSSGASAAAAVLAVNALLEAGLSRTDLLPFACEGESAATGGRVVDNVGPSLLGGLVLIRDASTLDIIDLPIPADLYVAVVTPQIRILTEESRSALSPNISLSSYISQSGNLAAFIHSLHTCDYDLIGRSLSDILIEPQRAPSIPGFYTAKEAALKNGALGCSISGSGPSIFALCRGKSSAEKVSNALSQVFDENNIANTSSVSGVNQQGAVVLKSV